MDKNEQHLQYYNTAVKFIIKTVAKVWGGASHPPPPLFLCLYVYLCTRVIRTCVILCEWNSLCCGTFESLVIGAEEDDFGYGGNIVCGHVPFYVKHKALANLKLRSFSGRNSPAVILFILL